MNTPRVAWMPVITLMISLCGCQTRTAYDHGTTLTFSPATLTVGSRGEKTWEQENFILVGTGVGDTSYMSSVSVLGSQKRLPSGDYSPVNGTDYLRFLTNQSKNGSVCRKNKQPFTPKSVDLAEYSMVFPVPHPVFFYGLKEDGSVVACAFVTDGIVDGPGGKEDFQTFVFPADFAGITHLCWAIGAFSMDNLRLD
jgi:hypothetical protein